MRWLAGIALLLLIGLATGASMLVYSAYVIIAVYLLTRFLSRRWSDAVTAARSVSSSELEIGQSTAISIKLDNRSQWPIVWMLLEDLLPRAAVSAPHPALTLQGAPLKLCSLPRRESKLLTYRLTAVRRGLFQIGPLVAETGDMFGLHRRFRTVVKPEMLLVLPKIIPLQGYSIASQRPIGEVRVTYRLFEDPTLISGYANIRTGTRSAVSIGEPRRAPGRCKRNNINRP